MPKIPKTLKNNWFFKVFGGAVLALEALLKGLTSQTHKRNHLCFNVFGGTVLALEALLKGLKSQKP